jgi:hypothetical protein
MSATTGIFLQAQRDIRYDGLFFLNTRLRERLAEIKQGRINSKQDNIQPFISDISKTHINYLTSSFRPHVKTTSVYSVSRSKGTTCIDNNTNTKLNFSVQSVGSFTSDMAIRIKFNNLGSQNASDSAPYYRLCSKPGIRLFENVKFKSKGTVLEEYSYYAQLFKDKCLITKDQEESWNNSIGQDVPKKVKAFNTRGFVQYMEYSNGFQTPKTFHENIELVIPLNFFFTNDPSTALYNKLIPESRREVEVTLAKLSDIVQCLDRTTLEPIALPIESLEFEAVLFTNNLYVNSEIDDIYASRINYRTVKVKKEYTKTLISESGTIPLSHLKGPIETLYVGFRDKTNSSDFDNWHQFGKVRTLENANKIMMPALQHTIKDGEEVPHLVALNGKEFEYTESMLSNFDIQSSGISLFPTTNTKFFRNYFPQRYVNKSNLVSNKDSSAYAIPCCLFPEYEKTNGCYYASANKEFKILYDNETNISNNNHAEVIIVATCLAVLTRDNEGNSVLKFTI